MLDHHDAGIGDIDPHLHHRGGHQDRDLPPGEVCHHPVLFRGRHLAVDQADPGGQALGQVSSPDLRCLNVEDFGFRHQRADPEGLGPVPGGVGQTLDDAVHPGQGGGRGHHRLAAGGLLVDARHVQVAEQGQLQGPGNGGGGQGDQVHGLPLGHQPSALRHAEPVLLVDHGQCQPMEADLVLEEGMGAHHQARRPIGHGGELFLPLGALVAPCEKNRLNARPFKGFSHAFKVLTGENLRGRHQGRLVARGGQLRHGQHGDHGLARAHIPLDEPGHPLPAGQIAADLRQGASLRTGETERQGRFHRPCEVGGGDRRGRLGSAPRLALGHGQVMGQKLVERQALAGRGGQADILRRLRMVQGVQRPTPARPALPGEPVGVLPLFQGRRAADGVQGKSAEDPGGQAGDAGIDGLQGADLVPPLWRQQMVRMGDLALDPEAFQLAAGHPLRSRGMGPLQVLAKSLEPDQVDEAGVVMGADPPGLSPALGRQVLVDDEVENGQLPVHRRAHRGGVSLDQARRAQERQVPHQGARRPLHQGRKLGPDALQRRDFSKQGKKTRRAHHRTIDRLRNSVKQAASRIRRPI